MSYKPNQPSIVPDSYLVMVKRPREKKPSEKNTHEKKEDGLSGAFPSADDMTNATRKMAEEIRKLARKHGETIQLDCGKLQGLGVIRLKCDRYFAELVRRLSSVAHVEQERSVDPPNKTPKFNR